ncbi:MAG: YdcF family protein, partial [Candidatus Acidiferrum sp.]
EACQYAAYLHNHWRPLPILVSGDAILMKGALVMFGVPETMISLENESHTTHENAVFSAKILRQKGIENIVLVTDARHMWRAQLAFRKQGLKVVPAACDYRSGGRWHLTDLLPDWEPIGHIEELLHETLGLIWYKVHGWI